MKTMLGIAKGLLQSELFAAIKKMEELSDPYNETVSKVIMDLMATADIYCGPSISLPNKCHIK